MNAYVDVLGLCGTDALPVTFVPGPRVALWAFLGTLRPERSERLDADALDALAHLGHDLAARRGEADALPILAVAEAAEAVRRSGGKWPSPDPTGPRPQRAPDGLDVPCLWGVRAVWFRLLGIFYASDIPSMALAAACDAAGSLAQVQAEWIGPPIVHPSRPPPSAAAYARAWRAFETALTRYAPLPLLPVLVLGPPRPARTDAPALRLVDAALSASVEDGDEDGAGDDPDMGPHAA